ncbi:MAG TPA: hybrid sensor histidine kinase/response regulator [Cyanobacteria bacterium UBA11372]|nr:hybrid sensor histidine kinase/response regulator [Cyanobacteria bacterium UBA11372]
MRERQKTIAIVDDSSEDRETIRRYLLEDEQSTYSIFEAEDGETGLALYQEVQPDAILLDFLLPDMDGLEFLEELKTQLGQTNLPVLMLTGQGNEAIAVQAIKSGAKEYLVKNKVTPANLQIAISNVIEQTQLQQQLEADISDRAQAQQTLQQARDQLEIRVAQRTAELQQANEELQTMLEELHVVEEELRQQNEELLQSKTEIELERQHYQDLFEFAPDGYLVTDVNGKIQEANRAAATLLGLQQQRLIDKLLILFIPQPERRSFRTQLAQLQQVQDWEVRLQPQHGEPFPAMLAVSSIKDLQGQQIGLRWLIRDISIPKQFEAKIAQQATLLDVATNAISLRDLEGQILYWNKGAEDLFGWTREEALGKNAFQILFKPNSPQLAAARTSISEQDSWQGELQKVTKSGKDILVESRWTLVGEEAGQPTSILIVDTDITEKKQLEQQFLHAQRLESIGTLASGIAHDLNNMLTPILLATQILKDRLTDAKSEQFFHVIEANAKRGADLVKQVLAFARGVEGKRVPLQLGHLLLEIEQIIQRTFDKSIEVQTNIPTRELWTVSADATQLHQVFMNLCVNARDAMPDGGTLNLSAENIFIDENYARMNLNAQVGRYVVITISDTGVGISPELLERIFDPFFTTKEVDKGTGLGLSTVLGIVKSHGGFVDISSEVGLGSQFKVYLPAVTATVTPPTEDLNLPRGQGELILVVDDEASIQEITKATLEERNYRVLTASDGLEAIALFVEHRNEISVVLMDIMMPNMDGITAIRTLQKINSQVKMIATSGLVSNDKLNEATGAGVQLFLHKPYTAKELLAALDLVINASG